MSAARKRPTSHIVGRHPKLTPDQVANLRAQLAAGVKHIAIAYHFNIGITTVKRYATATPKHHATKA